LYIGTGVALGSSAAATAAAVGAESSPLPSSQPAQLCQVDPLHQLAAPPKEGVLLVSSAKDSSNSADQSQQRIQNDVGALSSAVHSSTAQPGLGKPD
jgi:hypothetical protein